MSGTSMDGIDAIIIKFSSKPNSPPEFEMLAHHHIPFNTHYKDKARQVIEQKHLVAGFELGQDLAQHYADSVHQILERSAIEANAIEFCVVSGHTLFHRPPGDKTNGMTIDTTDLSMVAALTGITTIGKLRQKDMAFGGQGAPLAPFAHPFIFGHDHPCALIQNMGGLGNVTVLDAGHPRQGWDTGPGNTWIDQTIAWHSQGKQTFDMNGQLAAKGNVDSNLANLLLEHAFFDQAPPKSTGLNALGLPHIAVFRQQLLDLSIEDALATVTFATAKTVANAYQTWILPNHQPSKVILCGGGAKNKTLMQHLQDMCAPLDVISCEALGYDPSVIEALSFGFLGLYRYLNKPNILSKITGGFKDSVGGELAVPS